jgi:hypothetical protein
MAAKFKWMKSKKDGWYIQVNRSVAYPFSSTKQDSKKFAEFDSCGRKTIGRVGPRSEV